MAQEYGFSGNPPPLATPAVALLSAGLDSTTALAMYLNQGGRIVLALTVDYGQRAAPREIEHAHRIAKHFGVAHQVLQLPWMAEFPSGLTQHSQALPHPTQEALSDQQLSEKSAKAVWVPNRNGILIEIAAGFAESLGAASVVVGFNREEAATFPDNSAAYLEQLTLALRYSTQGRVQVVSPTLYLDKKEIVATAQRIGAPLDLVWSCYEGAEQPCGACESCQRWKRAMG